MTATRTWTPAEIDALSVSSAKILRERALTQTRSRDPVERRHGASLLLLWDVRIGRDAVAAVARRTADARAFLENTGPRDEARGRAREATRFLRGDREAERRFGDRS